MEILLIVDCQKEFVKDRTGLKIYNSILNYLRAHRVDYDEVWTTVYKNGQNVNMARLLNWEQMLKVENLDYRADKYFLHSGYAPITMDTLSQNDRVTVVGFDTDACVLATCFDLWDKQVNLRILANGCYSSGGSKMHNAGLSIMKRQFGKALDTVTRLE